MSCLAVEAGFDIIKGMEVFFNLIGFIMMAGAVGVVWKTAWSWHGVLRDGILLFLYGFIGFAAGFLWSAAYPQGAMHDLDIALFAVGSIFSLLGTRRVFSYTGQR